MTHTWNNWLLQNWERIMTRLYIVHPIYVTYMQSTSCEMPVPHILHHVKCQAGWVTSWNQDVLEKYQQPQICRWYHSNDRKWRGTKEPLDEGERGDWKSWLKTWHSKNWDHTSGPIISWQIDGEKVEAVTDYFGGLQNYWRPWLQSWNSKILAPWKKSYDKPRQHTKKQRCHFANKGPYSQSYGFSSSHV